MSTTPPPSASSGSLYRWDLDRTYLDSDIGTVRGMLRTALEPAHAKRAIPGATALMRALGRRAGHRIEIVSGSPEQMRRVLTEKLALDQVRVDALFLKDQVHNLRRGRLRAVRDQVGYKLPLLLAPTGSPPAREWLFGDDTEADPLIYALYEQHARRALPEQTLQRVLARRGVDAEGCRRIQESLSNAPRHPVAGAFIHVDRGVPLDVLSTLGAAIIPVFSWFQAAIVLWARGEIEPSDVSAVADDAGLAHRPFAMAGLLQDIVRRYPGIPAQAAADAWLPPGTLGEHVAATPAPSPLGSAPDFERFLNLLPEAR